MQPLHRPYGHRQIDVIHPDILKQVQPDKLPLIRLAERRPCLLDRFNLTLVLLLPQDNLLGLPPRRVARPAAARLSRIGWRRCTRPGRNNKTDDLPYRDAGALLRQSFYSAWSASCSCACCSRALISARYLASIMIPPFSPHRFP